MSNTKLMTSLALVGAIFAGTACADEAADAQALMKKNNCLTCHSVEKKIVGPAYKDVAAKYKGQADAEAKLVAKVKKGGSGSFGTMPMPPQAAKAEDVQAIVHYVLSL
ncbi:MAG: c-type cytochrome [Sideroxydans sp.]|nr:c-type cytochrome [Sideroxyarcus sp.]